jgi:CheY-like chemotaxis protein
MISCIVIDDNQPVCENLKFALGEQYPDKIQVVAMAFSIAKAKIAIEAHLPDVIFLDAHLPNEGGPALISWLYRSNIYKGIEHIKVFLYTAKTEVYETIKDSEWKYPVRILNKGIQTIPNFEVLITETENWIAADRAAKTIRINPETVYVGDIQYFKSVAPNTQIETQTAKKTLMAGYSLAHFKKMITDQPTATLPLPQHFFFATNDYIFNRLFIKQYQHEIITLQNDLEISIARTQKAAFEAWW